MTPPLPEIVPYPGDPDYGVTRCGRVFRIVRSRRGRPVPFELKQRFDSDGYLLTSRAMKVHRLVAETFIPNPNGLPQVAHGDNNRANNQVGNLRWDSCRGNFADMVRHGTRRRGTALANAKLTPPLVAEARHRARHGETHTSIAEDMPVDRSVLSRAIRKDTWAHV